MAVGVFHRRKVPHLPPPVEIDDPIIAKAMTVPEINVPEEGHFKGIYTDDEIADLGKRDRKTIRAMSILEQWSVWHTERVAELWGHVRLKDAEIVQLRIENEKLRTALIGQGLKVSIGIWISSTLGAGVIAALIKITFDFVRGK